METSIDVLAPFDAVSTETIDHVVVKGATVLRYFNPFDGVFLTVGEYRAGSPARFELVGRGMVSLLFSLFGQSTFIDKDGREIRIPANSFGILYRSEGAPYEVCLADGCDTLTLGLHMTLEALSRKPLRTGLGRYRADIEEAIAHGHAPIGHHDIPSALRPLILSTALCWRNSDHRPLEAAIRTLELIDGINRFVGQDKACGWLSSSRGDIDRLISAKDAIDKGYGQPLALPHLAEIARMSETKFKSAFRLVFGVPPMTYLLQVRMERAKEMLRAGQSSVGQVAWQVGYAHQCNFTVAFKRFTGVSPKSFRQSEIGHMGHFAAA